MKVRKNTLERIRLEAHAKINLSLDVTGRLENGYHTLQMIMQTISLCDEVILEKTLEGIEIICDDPDLPCDERNICHRAAKEFFERTGIARNGSDKTCQKYTGVRIDIKKRIPAAAGLAGGSADAAAVLKGLNILYRIGLDLRGLAEIGVRCGADVPFCLYGGTCLAEGIGEKLTRLPSFSGVGVVVIVPEFSVSTEWVYRNYSMNDCKKHPDTSTLITAIKAGDIEKVARGMVNVLESVTVVKYPEINDIKLALRKSGAMGTLMSGSGPSVFGLFEAPGKARDAFEELKNRYKRIYLVSTTDGGEIYGEDF